jgi:hypothetical protein
MRDTLATTENLAKGFNTNLSPPNSFDTFLIHLVFLGSPTLSKHVRGRSKKASDDSDRYEQSELDPRDKSVSVRLSTARRFFKE